MARTSDMKILLKFSDDISLEEEDAIFAEVFDILQLFNEEFNKELINN